MRDTLILAPVSIAILGLIWFLDLFMMGASNDLVERWLPLYFLAWVTAWLLGMLLMKCPIFPKDLSHCIRCIVCILLFWPILGIASATAEEWTISHRRATWIEPSDMGYTYMYGEMSGMGYAGGWHDCSRKIAGHCVGGLFAGLVWMPALLLSCFVWRKILGDSPKRTDDQPNGEQVVPSDGHKPSSRDSSTDPTAPADAH